MILYSKDAEHFLSTTFALAATLSPRIPIGRQPARRLPDEALVSELLVAGADMQAAFT